MICSVISAKGQSLKEVVAQAETDTANVYLPADSLFARFLKEKQIPVTPCNRMTLLKSGRSKFEHLFEDIKKFRNGEIRNTEISNITEKRRNHNGFCVFLCVVRSVGN